MSSRSKYSPRLSRHYIRDAPRLNSVCEDVMDYIVYPMIHTHTALPQQRTIYNKLVSDIRMHPIRNIARRIESLGGVKIQNSPFRDLADHTDGTYSCRMTFVCPDSIFGLIDELLRPLSTSVVQIDTMIPNTHFEIVYTLNTDVSWVRASISIAYSWEILPEVVDDSDWSFFDDTSDGMNSEEEFYDA